MFNFCPHCGAMIGQDQAAGQALKCRACGKPIGTVQADPAPKMVDLTEDAIRRGDAARCPLCGQAVELRKKGAVKSYVPHFGMAQPRKICPNSGKPATS